MCGTAQWTGVRGIYNSEKLGAGEEGVEEMPE